MGNRRNSCVNPSKLVRLTQLSCVYKQVGGNLKKQLTTKNIQENEAISNCKIE